MNPSNSEDYFQLTNEVLDLSLNETLNSYPGQGSLNYTLDGDLNFTIMYVEGPQRESNVIVSVPGFANVYLTCDSGSPDYVNFLKADTDKFLGRRL